MAAKLLNLIALSSLAILACSWGPTATNALSVDTPHNIAARHHGVIAKKKRGTTARRCKPRPASLSSAAKPTTTPAPAPAPTTTPKANPATSTKASGGSGTPSNTGGYNGPPGKVGLAYAGPDDGTISHFITPKVTAIYNWSPWAPASAAALGLEFMPMLWGPKQIGDFTQLVKPGYAKTVLGFNEPNQSGQSNLDPGYAAQLWQQYIQPLKNQGYALVTPACTNAPSGKQWYQSFFSACTGCTFDIIAVHYYGTSPQDFINYITDIHNTFNLDVFVTEFACQNFGGGAQCSDSDVTNFMDTVTGFMDSTSWVKKYFAFGLQHDMVGVNPANQLLASNGYPTALGKDYIN
ncbi:glycoside hydrolase family 128 protein [Laccaria amethystina LaAM-08-1]|uniref:Glycoside hydrolase family 128 protein n=1 Tax=Laccaria amethystina LaAM-08-1 TaxID=1095629 RepID=A0A0C9YDH1_9AGAR|nr:glycoside hydrolase family 128 protein [Laccaria amethystina LaAM-08-1]